ncbi:MAG: J domain-containing protein [Bdellovibrionales bacterium]|nr:J domain-containing protein [Bdellovibrionales bacterium]
MEKTFRDILSEFLEEETPVEPVQQLFSPRETSFFWQGPRPTTHATKGSYPSPARITTPLAAPVEPQAAPVEHLIPLADLAESDRKQAQVLLALGASELNDGVSEKRLKKAHRRLAKRLHPDMQQKESAPIRERHKNLFMNLQTAYESLLEALPHYKTAA